MKLQDEEKSNESRRKAMHTMKTNWEKNRGTAWNREQRSENTERKSEKKTKLLEKQVRNNRFYKMCQENN